MEIFLDTANIEDIRKAYELGIVAGVTTNPTILLREKRERTDIVKEIIANSTGIVFVQVTGETFEEMYEEGIKIYNLNKERIGVKVPVNTAGIKTIKALKTYNKDIPILATAIFTCEQGLIAALAGADYIAPYINRMENNGLTPGVIIQKIRNIYDEGNLQTKILAASFKNTGQVVNILDQGAHGATVSYEVLHNMVNSKLADDSISAFQRDWLQLQDIIEK